jgi:phosphomannomutase
VAEAACAALATQFEGGKVDTQDGVRIDFDGGGEDPAWVHVRASNTEPILRLIAEAKTSERATQLLDEAQRVVEGL